MKRFGWIATILLIPFAQYAHADTFDLTTITVDVVPNITGENVFFSLIGPGTNITGVGGIACQTWCSPSVTFPLGSGVFPNIGQIFLSNFNTAMVGGTSYSTQELAFNSTFRIDVLGQIVLPGHPESSFSACVPATGEGPISGFAGSGATFTQFSLNTPAGGTFCTNWTFVDSLDGYQFEGGKFSVSTVPEPGSLGLMASGLAGILGAVLRKRRAQNR